MFPIESSHMKSVGYDRETEIMYIEFGNNQVYQYLDVQENVYNNLKNASSPGAFFMSSVKKYYQSSRIINSVTSDILTLEYEPK